MKTKGQYDNAYVPLPASGEGLGVGLTFGPTSPPAPLRVRRGEQTFRFIASLTLLFAFLISPGLRGRVLAQDTDRIDPKLTNTPLLTYVIRNARIVTVSGADIENGTLVISNGRIAAVGANATVPAGAQEIDGRGLIVYPGMIDLATNMGLAEIPTGAPGTMDTTELGDMNPNIAAIWAVNPHSAHIAVTRVAGVTNALSGPSGGIISGQAAFVNLFGSSPREMALVPEAALVIQFPRIGGGGFGGGALNITPEALTQRDRRIEELRKIFRDAEAYGRTQDAYRRDPRSVPRPAIDLKLAALVPYARGERPIIFRAERDREMRAVIRFAEELKLKPIILGASEGWKIASFLKQKDVPVILDGVLNLPLREDDGYDSMYENASKLQAAGVRFCISAGDSGAHTRDLPFNAGMAAAYGLPKAEALKSVTLYPAQILGVADRLGSIEAGKLANLVITDGDMLEARTNVRHLFIAGRQLPLVSRHTMLNDQFKDRK
ncbi:MAG TPA: amidohydrolase family protein [Pyrinomonadaceae bacterium]|nr:amidohydrolase family protein [Pyrinomonadaceae bacterium]